MIRTAEYSNLLFIVSHRLSENFIVANYLVEDIWRMWSVSKEHLSIPVYKQTREQLKRVLLRKEFALTPDSEMVIRIPSGAQHSRHDIVSSLRQALLISYIPHRVCDHALASVRVVKLADRTLGPLLIMPSNGLLIIIMCTGLLP